MLSPSACLHGTPSYGQAESKSTKEVQRGACDAVHKVQLHAIVAYQSPAQHWPRCLTPCVLQAPAAAQPTAAHLPGGTPASDGSTRTGVNLSRSTSPAADMPHGPHSLPIPDFVCQSFEQQALCPVDRQADVEAAQPVPDVPLPAPRRKPGRKPKKVRPWFRFC